MCTYICVCVCVCEVMYFVAWDVYSVGVIMCYVWRFRVRFSVLRECCFILCCMVAGEPVWCSFFFMYTYLLFTLLTRAKSALLMVGDISSLAQDPSWKRIIGLFLCVGFAGGS
jgi:hypothetical protein